MSAQQHLAGCQTMGGPPFAIKRSRARKLTPLVPPSSACEKPAPAMADEDLALIQRAAAGDSEAQTRLFATHTPRLYRVSLKVLRNKEDAEDAVQDTWSRAYSKLHTFEGRSSISTWLTRVAINSALMIRRKQVRRPETSLDEMLGNQRERTHHEIVHTGPNPEQICARSEAVALMKKQVCDLSPRLRLTFQLCDLEGYPAADVIQSLGLRHGSLKSRLCRARKKIANGLRRSLQRPTGESRELSLAPAQVFRTKNRSVEGEMYECYNSGDICQEVGGLVHRA
jgi:RNA polymerase sigma-70 factor (ECF subfamily)